MTMRRMDNHISDFQLNVYKLKVSGRVTVRHFVVVQELDFIKPTKLV